MRITVLLAATLIVLGGCHDDSGTPSGSNGPTTPPPPAAVAPSITAQPADQSVSAGQSASFSVTATGTAPLTYQWQRDAQPIAGATGASYTLDSTAVADSGAKFTVTVSNSAGSATSNSATLTVTALTTPSHLVVAAVGGEVSSDDHLVSISLPPNALTADATVTISAPGSDWTLPASLPPQFTVVPGTTRLISTQGGAFDPKVQFNISFASAGLPNQSAAVARDAHRVQAKAAARTRSRTAASLTPWAALGVAVDCGDGKPVILIMPPEDGYGTGTFIAGCPAPASTSVVTWTPPVSQAPPPAGTVIWDTALPGVVPMSGDGLPSCTAASCQTASRGDTYMGSTTYSISAAILNDQFGAGNLLITLVDGNGHLLAQELLPYKLDGISPSMTNILLDGPGNFYLTLGTNRTTNYVSRFALMFPANSPASFQQLWVSTLTGVAVASTDVLDTPNVVGSTFAVDSTTGALVGLAGAGAYAQLSDDDRARLRSSADGFVVRLDRAGKLVWATPVMSAQTLSFNAAALSPQRFLEFALNIDHAGNTYVAAGLCCTASNQDGVSGVTLKKIDVHGSLIWEANLGDPDEVGGVAGNSLDEGYAASVAIDANNNAYVTYYRDSVPGSAQGSHMYVSKVSAQSGSISGIGYVDPAVEASHFAIPYGERSIFSYIDEQGNLYLPIDFLGSPSSSELIALNPALQVIGQTPLPLQTLGGGVQVDASGNIYQQQSEWNGPPSYIMDLKKFHF